MYEIDEPGVPAEVTMVRPTPSPTARAGPDDAGRSESTWSPARCWRAVSARDAAADGRFCFGVATTGVYCRPGCASRRPRRENVSFFRNAAAAEAAGFRACKRCRPDEASAVAPQRALVERACALLRERDPAPNLAELAIAVGASRFHLHRLFKQIVGVTPREYARTARLRRFEATLGSGARVTPALLAAGFGSSSRAYEAAATGLGMTPGARRRGGRGETIRYVCAPTPIGWILVAATARGICAAELGDAADPLVKALRARFPEATLRDDRGRLRAWARRIARFVAAPGDPAHALDLPLDVRGTAFQAQVWRALRAIPPGRTASYAAIAAALGRPQAVRAVARACASNPVAVLVPCHRAIRSDGRTGGYRWGEARKRALLAREATASASDR